MYNSQKYHVLPPMPFLKKGKKVPGAKEVKTYDIKKQNISEEERLHRAIENGSVTKMTDWKQSAIVFLNDNFSGGEIYYSNLNLSIKPIACSMIVHPANEVYRHGVAEVISGTRYILSAFLTLPPIK